MYIFKNQHAWLTRLAMSVILGMISLSLISQESKYLGTEPNITHEELLQKAANMDFKSDVFKAIYHDSKNTYYALLTEKISSRYEKIKLLEKISTDKSLVNIGASPTSPHSLFLVNNSLGKSETEIEQLVNDLIDQVHTEAMQINEEQQQQWLLKNDKYSGNK
ncbi:MAG: hypothetical protein CVT99_03125 [Bacteroidetes bacterium HGW-Bacteroidetes-16]|jgi:uncharacterized protein with von Willebrand factor type A (vWA) domain|nr:MAG: hypothetical protein CVT99_03125 [Bacteroidetes bacterium HGW-Bacteroidetes-16]